MAFRKEDESFRSAVNQIIVDMKADGTLASLQEKWFGQSFVDLLPDEAPTW
jgi:ABC-type amino acid transport substrate-binding protein